MLRLGDDEQIDVFRVLSHPLRRKILRFIAEKGSASYKDLTKIVPKPGALYHHLRLLGDLIYQDDRKLYRLTKKGERVYEFLISEFFVPEDKSIHKILTPRVYFEQLEGLYAIPFIMLFVATIFLWLLTPNLIPIFLLVIETQRVKLNILIVLTNYACSVLMLKLLIRIIYSRNVSYLDLLAKSMPVFIIINLYPILFCLVMYETVFAVIYMIMQIFAILFAISAVSVVSRLHLRSALTVVLVLHYIALIIVMCLLGYVKIY